MLLLLAAVLVAAFVITMLGFSDYGAALLTGWGALLLALIVAGIGAALWRVSRTG